MGVPTYTCTCNARTCNSPTRKLLYETLWRPGYAHYPHITHRVYTCSDRQLCKICYLPDATTVLNGWSKVCCRAVPCVTQEDKVYGWSGICRSQPQNNPSLCTVIHTMKHYRDITEGLVMHTCMYTTGHIVYMYEWYTTAWKDAAKTYTPLFTAYKPVLCPLCARLLARNGLFPKTVEDQCDYEIANYYIPLPLQH